MQMMGGQMETMEEDIEMLRQILDNLVIYSFEQEELMEEFQSIDYGNAMFGKILNVQNDLKLNFQHIDDSLFEISLRQPMISEAVNESITEVQYNIDKAMERLAESEMRQGIANQQYAVTGANELAILLSELLGNMQDQMQSSGQGQGQGHGHGVEGARQFLEFVAVPGGDMSLEAARIRQASHSGRTMAAETIVRKQRQDITTEIHRIGGRDGKNGKAEVAG